MDCLKPNCNTAGNNQMISCWICCGAYHLKCTPLKPRDADALDDPAKSMQWTCPQCKQINIEFYKFFKSYKNQFENLTKEFLNIQSMFLDFGELFTKFKNLDNYITSPTASSPKRKKTLNKSPITRELTVVTAVTPATPMDTTKDNTKNKCSVPHVPKNQDSLPTTPSIQNHQNVYVNNVPDTNNNNLLVSLPHASVNNILIPHNPLRAIPPKRSIFLSRLASDTTSEDINFYIKNKISTDADIIIHKFQFPQSRLIASFKITVSDDIYKHIIETNFWPKNTLVREFIFKDRRGPTNVGVLPQPVQSISKN